MRILILIFIMSVLAACGNTAVKKDPLYKKVMAIHDEVMPKMSDIHTLKKKIKKSKSSTTDEAMDLLKQLKDADEGMMSWMHQFKLPSDDKATTSYLKNELTKVQKVADDINNSIAKAKKYLNENK